MAALIWQVLFLSYIQVSPFNGAALSLCFSEFYITVEAKGKILLANHFISAEVFEEFPSSLFSPLWQTCSLPYKKSMPNVQLICLVTKDRIQVPVPQTLCLHQNEKQVTSNYSVACSPALAILFLLFKFFRHNFKLYHRYHEKL